MRNDTSRLRGLAEQILKLHKKGLSYKKIAKELGCSLSTVSYHLSKGQISNDSKINDMKQIVGNTQERLIQNILSERSGGQKLHRNPYGCPL